MNQLQTQSAADAARPRDTRRTRHGLIEDWRDALGILLLLFVAASLGAILTRYWPDTDVHGDPGVAELESRLSALEGNIARLSPAGDMATVKQRLTGAEKRLAGVEANLQALGASPGDAAGAAAIAPASLLETAARLNNATTRLAELEKKTATLPADVAAAREALDKITAGSTAQANQLAEVDRRLQKIESSDILALARRASLASSIANLTRAVQGSSPFKTEYDVVAALMPGEPGLQDIAPFATSGLPTTGTLISTFGNSAGQALDAERRAAGNGGLTQLWTNFSSLISWRSTTEQTGSTSESRLARAEIRLKAGDLPAAVRELSAIRGPAAKSLAPWLRKAEARVRVEAILAGLNARAIDAITGKGDSAEAVPQLPEP